MEGQIWRYLVKAWSAYKSQVWRLWGNRTERTLKSHLSFIEWTHWFANDHKDVPLRPGHTGPIIAVVASVGGGDTILFGVCREIGRRRCRRASFEPIEHVQSAADSLSVGAI